MTLYLAYHNDKYELPAFVGNISEMVEWLGISENTLHCAMTRIKKGKQHSIKGYGMYKFKIEKE